MISENFKKTVCNEEYRLSRVALGIYRAFILQDLNCGRVILVLNRQKIWYAKEKRRQHMKKENHEVIIKGVIQKDNVCKDEIEMLCAKLLQDVLKQ